MSEIFIGSEGSDAADAEFDKWLQGVNDSICDSLDDVVDTETDLLRVKQNVAQKAVAVAHASGSDGATQAIRSVLAEDDLLTSASFESGVRRVAPGPGPRGSTYRKKRRRAAGRSNNARQWRARLRLTVLALFALLAVGAVGALFLFTPSGVAATAAMVVTGSAIIKRWRWVAAPMKEEGCNNSTFRQAIGRPTRSQNDDWSDLLCEQFADLGTDPAPPPSRLQLSTGGRWRLKADGQPPPGRWWLEYCKLPISWIALSPNCATLAVKPPAVESKDDLTTDVLREDLDEDLREPPLYGGTGGVAVRSSSNRRRFAADNMRRSPQRPPNAKPERAMRRSRE